MPPNPPRRRITDRDRRRWSDDRLDDLKNNVDDLEAEHRAVARLPGEVAALVRAFEQYQKASDGRMTSMHEDIRELRAESRRAHKRVQDTTETIAQTVTPTRWTKFKDMATIVSLLLVPILAAYVAAGGR